MTNLNFSNDNIFIEKLIFRGRQLSWCFLVFKINHVCGSRRYQVLSAEVFTWSSNFFRWKSRTMRRERAEGFESYRLGTGFVFLRSKASQKYTQPFRIPHARRAVALLVSFVNFATQNLLAETEGFKPSRPFKGSASLAKRYVRPLHHVSSRDILAQMHSIIKSLVGLKQ